MPATVLYLDMVPNDPSQIMKLAGIGRYAALRGWDVVCAARDDVHPAGLDDVLARHRPVGAIVEGSGRRAAYPPRLFGSVPVAYIEYPAAETAGKAPNVVIDDAAVADVAFRELSQGRPAAFAAVGFKNPHLWSRLRVAAFRKRCASDGVRCISFPAKKDEMPGDYENRLARWIAKLPRRTAVFAASNASAAAATRAAAAAHRHIPNEITLVAFGDIPGICDNASPPFTTIQFDFERMGFVAARALGEIISRRGAETQRSQKLCGSAPLREERGSRISQEPKALPIGPLLVTRRKSTAGRGRREPWVMKAVEIIRAEACDGLTIDDLVGRLETEKGRPVSRRNFDRRFREAVGHSANEELISVRLAAACELLRGGMRITAVPDFCGAGCYRTLDAMFRTRFGMSMGAWRERHAR